MDDSGSRLSSARLRELLGSEAALRVRGLLRNRIVLFGAGPALLLVIGLIYLMLNAGVVSTDDATVSAARVAISSEVRGRIVSVEVHDNQLVHAGDVLVRLDDTDYQTALANAEAQLASAQLQVEASHAQYSYAQREYARQRNLFAAGVASRHDVEEAQSAADVAARQAGVTDGRILPVDQHPLVLAAQAALTQAQTNLADTTLRAPREGIVTRVDQVQIGTYAQPAQTLFWLISGQPWVDAAFKEDQLERLQPGQPVLIHIDAYPHESFRGHVVSLSPGTGAAFSVLPTQNSSGNWVKVVQRLNVRIAFEALPHGISPAIGLSASVRVDTNRRAGPPLRGRED
ncbi:MAG: HlyD family secretion protein [Proteobacteria bacterium]|nr:HlyD family secretion protein [Pseudomonadota bacterium]